MKQLIHSLASALLGYALLATVVVLAAAFVIVWVAFWGMIFSGYH